MLHHFELVPNASARPRARVLMRKYACCYAQGRRGAREFRKHVATIETAAAFYAVVERFFPSESV